MEIWKEFAPYYEVSSLGKIRSYKRGSQRILKQRKSRSGYMVARIFPTGKEFFVLVHRAVAEAFIPNPENKPQVNHINGIKTDNRVDNLEWVTASENKKHAHKTGLVDNPKGEKHPGAKLLNEQVEWIRNNYVPYDREHGLIAISKMFSVSASVIFDVIHGNHYPQANGVIHGKADRKLPDYVREEIRQLYKKNVRGSGTHSLAKKFGVTKTTIRRILNETNF